MEKRAVTDKQFTETKIPKLNYIKPVVGEKSVSEIVAEIKNETWPDTLEMDITEYVREVSPNQFAPIMKKLIQSRPVIYDPVFVERSVRRSKNQPNINKSLPATVVFFPEDTIINGQKIESNTYILIDRIHGMVIDRYLGKTVKIANVVNFKKDLGSDELKLYRLGNLLNDVEIELQPLVDDAIKMELYRLMDKRISEGKEGKPSDEERKSFLRDYSQINVHQWSIWVANHTSGGRSAPYIKYSTAERKVYHEELKDRKSYEDWVISTPSTIMSYSGETLGRVLIECCTNETRKLLMPLYASNDSQFKKLKEGKIQKKIENRFKELKEFYYMEEMEFIIMKFQSDSEEF